MTDLAIKSVSVAMGTRTIVEDVTADIPAGTFTCLLGPNGAGKSTLLRAVAGLSDYRGTVSYAGRPVGALSRAERAKLFGYLPQDHQLHWPLLVSHIVGLGRFPHGALDPAALPEQDRLAVENAMAACDVIELADQRATSLSGGERARVALARVLATQSPIILADEPIASLDPHHQLAVMELLQQRARAGAIVIAVTHDIDLASAYADRLLVLQAGRLVADGPAHAALSADVLKRVFRLSKGADGRWTRT